MTNPMAFVVESNLDPEIGFAVTVSESDYHRATYLARIALYAWTSCGGGEDRSPEYDEFFPNHPYEDDYWYSVGWSEPAQELLEREGIEFEIEPCFQEEGQWLEGFDVDKVVEIYD